ncbi:proline iminopeptidase [Ramaria rubella]|nr:proline iminopeptidase [Ramaria rubella]
MSPKVTEGYAEYVVPAAAKRCQTWYKIIGDLKARTHRPLLVLHGGPGMVHNYLLAYADLASLYSIPVVFYDQLGNGNSTHLQEKAGDGTFWTEQLFMDELDNLIRHLGIEDDYDILGHSWGGMLAAMHTVKQPKGLHRLILQSSPASMELWDEAQGDLRAKLPTDVQETLTKHEAEGTTDSAEYKAAIGQFYARHACKLDPLPEDLLAMFAWAEKDPTVLLTMYGPDEFHTLGTLKHWTIMDESHKITVPTLLMNGRDDTAQDKVLEPYFRTIARVRWVQFAQSSHTAHMEERDRVMRIVGDFLTL